MDNKNFIFSIVTILLTHIVFSYGRQFNIAESCKRVVRNRNNTSCLLGQTIKKGGEILMRPMIYGEKYQNDPDEVHEIMKLFWDESSNSDI